MKSVTLKVRKPAKAALLFTMDETQKAKLDAWVKEQDAVTIKKNLNSSNGVARSEAREGRAYYGAIGGVLTYCFSPNSIGECLTVKHAGTGNEINLTDYDSW